MKKTFNSFNIILMTALVVLIFMCCTIFGYAFSHGSLIVSTSNQLCESYYMVEMGSFANYLDAQVCSSEIMLKGGAGYIWYAGEYKVFLSAYTKLNDAKNVAEKNNGEVFELKLGSLNDNPNKVIKNNVLCMKNCIDSLENLMTNFQNNKMNETAVKNNCLLLVEEIDLQQAKFDDIFYESADMYKYRKYFDTFSKNYDDILELDCEGSDFLKNLQYHQIDCMLTLKNILSIV